MSRIAILTLACSVAFVAAQYNGGSYRYRGRYDPSSSSYSDEEFDEYPYSSEEFDEYPRHQHPDYSNEESPFLRRKREADTDIDPFIGPEEGREQHEHRRPHHHSTEDSDSNDDDDDFDSVEHDHPRFIPPHRFPVPFQPQPMQVPAAQPVPIGAGAHSIPPAQPVLVPVGDQPVGSGAEPIPPARPIILPVAEEGTGLVEDQLFVLPEPAAQSGEFRRPGPHFPAPTTTITTTPAPAPVPSRPSGPSGGFTPSATLTCSSVRCPSGAVCRMENNRFSRREEPVCVFVGSSSPTSCAQVRCSDGFNCEMQQTSSCSRLPCPFNPVCVQAPTTPAAVLSCDNVRCSAGTVCRLQTADNCTVAPCSILPTCVSPCASVTCPSNRQCIVEPSTLATSCIPNGPTQLSVSCSGIRCGFGERCAIVKNCHWSRDCKDEARCIKF